MGVARNRITGASGHRSPENRPGVQIPADGVAASPDCSFQRVMVKNAKGVFFDHVSAGAPCSAVTTLLVWPALNSRGSRSHHEPLRKRGVVPFLIACVAIWVL